MEKFLPRPLLSISLLVIWLLLNETMHIAHWLLGGVISLLVPIYLKDLLPPKVRIRKPFVLVRLLAWSLLEIVRSCFNVAQVILFKKNENVRSEYIKVPLDLKDPYGLALLSCLINCTPGTVWVDILPDNHELLLHVFDIQSEEWWIDTIKTRYEKPIMEIFEGDAHANRA